MKNDKSRAGLIRRALFGSFFVAWQSDSLSRKMMMIQKNPSENKAKRPSGHPRGINPATTYRLSVLLAWSDATDAQREAIIREIRSRVWKCDGYYIVEIGADDILIRGCDFLKAVRTVNLIQAGVVVR